MGNDHIKFIENIVERKCSLILYNLIQIDCAETRLTDRNANLVVREIQLNES